jgi:hypothetical protein
LPVSHEITREVINVATAKAKRTDIEIAPDTPVSGEMIDFYGEENSENFHHGLDDCILNRRGINRNAQTGTSYITHALSDEICSSSHKHFQELTAQCDFFLKPVEHFPSKKCMSPISAMKIERESAQAQRLGC